MTHDDYITFRCPKCLEEIEIEPCYAPWEHQEEIEVECTHCKYKMRVRCECTFKHKLIAEVDGEEYDVSDYYSDEFDVVNLKLNGTDDDLD